MKNIKNALFGLLLMSSMSLVYAQNWAGSYMGLHLGTTDVNLEHSDSTSVDPGMVYKKDANKTFGGLYFGHNFQWGEIVAGPEFEFSVGKVKFDNNTWQFPAGAEVGQDCSWCNYEISNTARLRLRAGYVYEKSTLLFITGGLATAKFKYTDADPIYGSYKGNLSGTTFGLGLEHAFYKNFSFRAEYIRDQFGSKDFVVPAAVGTDPFNAKIKASADTFRVGLTYKF